MRRVEPAGQARILGHRQPKIVRVEGHFGEGLFHPGHTRDADFAVAQLEIAGIGLQHMRRDADQLLPELLGCPDNRAGEHDREPASARPGAIEAVITVAVGDDDVLRMELQLLGENLGRDRLRAVAPERRLQRDVDLAGRVHLQRNAFGRAGQRKPRLLVEHPELGGAEDAALLARGDSDADVSAVLARLLLSLAPLAVVQ